MKILLIAPRFFPIYNKENKGAIETLERIYLDYNEKTSDYFTVYSPKISKDGYDDAKLQRAVFRPIDQTKLAYKAYKLFGAIRRRVAKTPNNENYIRLIVKDIKRRKEQNKYDLIIFENGEQDIPLFKKLTKTTSRIVLHLHNDYVNEETKNAKKIVSACDEIWTVSNFLSKRISQIGNTKTITIPNTIDQTAARANTSKCVELGKQYDSKNNIIFLYIGRILEVKGIRQLLEAYKIYSRRNTNSKLLIIGEPDGGRAGKRMNKILREYIKSNESIKYLGYVKPSDLASYRAMADCQIIPSMWEEAFGLVVLEAMDSNLKIIASKSGGIPEIAKNRITYVRRENIINDLFNAMNSIDKTRLKDGYYSDIVKKYSKEKYCNNIYKAIHEQ